MNYFGYIRKEKNTSIIRQFKLLDKYDCKDIWIEEEACHTDKELMNLINIVSMESTPSTIVVANLFSFGKTLIPLNKVINA